MNPPKITSPRLSPNHRTKIKLFNLPCFTKYSFYNKDLSWEETSESSNVFPPLMGLTKVRTPLC